MSSDSTWNVQAALYTALSSASALTAQLATGANSVFDHVPPSAAMPYIVIGAMSSQPFETQGDTGSDMTVVLHTYSKNRGLKETRNIMTAIFDALHNGGLTVTGHDVVLCREISADSFLDGDAETRRGVQKFRIITEPNA